MVKYVLRNQLNGSYYMDNNWLFKNMHIDSAKMFNTLKEAEDYRVNVLKDAKFSFGSSAKWEAVKVMR